MFKTLAAIGLLLCALASPAAAANLVLVEDGQARAQVVIPDDASDRCGISPVTSRASSRG